MTHPVGLVDLKEQKKRNGQELAWGLPQLHPCVGAGSKTRGTDAPNIQTWCFVHAKEVQMVILACIQLKEKRE